jgi:hypothetical protein
MVSDDARNFGFKNDIELKRTCKIEDTSWIKPVKYVGVWWEMIGKSSWSYTNDYPSVQLERTFLNKTDGTHGATTTNVKKYIDLLLQNGFGGV